MIDWIVKRRHGIQFQFWLTLDGHAAAANLLACIFAFKLWCLTCAKVEGLTICCNSTRHFHESSKAFFIDNHFSAEQTCQSKFSHRSIFYSSLHNNRTSHDDNFASRLNVNDINHEKDTEKKCKSHSKASILVSPKMHKSLGNYSYTRSRKERRATREEQATKAKEWNEKHNHSIYFSFSWFHWDTSFTIIFMFRCGGESRRFVKNVFF